MSLDRADPAMRTYVRRVVPTMTVYVALIVALPFAIYATGAEGPLLWLLAVLPAIPLCAVFWMIGRLLADLKDEYVRMLEVRKALIATGISMAFASIWGFLDVYAHAPHLSLYYAPVAWFAGWAIAAGISAIIERRRVP